MQVSPIPHKVLYSLATFVKFNISEEQLEKGYALYRLPDSVEWLHADSDTLTAICKEDDDHFHVEILPSEEENFFCSCGEYLCKHSLAVFLNLFRLAGKNPEMFLAECNMALSDRERRKKQQQPSSSSQPAASLPRGLPKDAHGAPYAPLDGPQVWKTPKKPEAAPKSGKRKATNSFPRPDDSVAVWRSYLHERFNNVLVAPRPSAYLYGSEPQILTFYYEVMETMASASANWPPTPRGLLVLHAQLYAMETIDRYFAKLPFSPHYNMNQIWGQLVHATFEHAGEILALIDRDEVRDSCRSVWGEALEILGQNTFHKDGSRQDWMGLYRIIWTRTFSWAEQWIEEQTRLDKLLLQADSQGLEARIRSGLALFDFLSGDDAAALSRLTANSSISRLEGAHYLVELSHSRQWKRLLLWLQSLATPLKRDPYFLEQVIFPIWLEAAEAEPDEPGWRKWIEGMLPQAREVYTAYLIRNGEAKQVAHMLLSEGLPLYYTDKQVLKLLEKEDPRLMLPLYHQDAERYILEKNRQSYKQAVRLLKKLAAIYKKLKEQDRWQAYVEQLASRFSRLRAFQEELRKGKLIG